MASALAGWVVMAGVVEDGGAIGYGGWFTDGGGIG